MYIEREIYVYIYIIICLYIYILYIMFFAFFHFPIPTFMCLSMFESWHIYIFTSSYFHILISPHTSCMFTLSMLFLCSLFNIYVSDFHIVIFSCLWIFTFFIFAFLYVHCLLLSRSSLFVLLIFQFFDFHMFTFSLVCIFTCLHFPILHVQTVCMSFSDFTIYIVTSV